MVNSIKYLGVTLDNELDLSLHIENVRKNMASKVNYLKRISKNLTFETKKIIYNAIVLPHLLLAGNFIISRK